MERKGGNLLNNLPMYLRAFDRTLVYLVNSSIVVVVDNDNLSLAIGKKGLNVRLASKLTHYKIDVKTYDQAKEEGINILE